MTTFNGQLDVSVIWNDDDTVNSDIGSMDVPVWNEAAEAAFFVRGTLTDTQPILENPETHVGYIAEMYGFLHWYNRIHIQYTILNLGNVVGDQEIDFWILNTYFVSKTMDDIVETGVEGLTLVQPSPGSPPHVFAPFEEKTFTLEVSTVGPPELAATYEFDFGAAGILTLDVTGVRVIGWIWEPNWAQEIIERLKWVSDVMESYNGKGQFVQLRQYPKQEWEFLVDVDKRRARQIETNLYGWNGRVWALPVWPDIEVLTSALLAGATSVNIPTSTKAYKVGGLAMFISADGNFYETAEIEAVNLTSLDFVRPLARAWGTGSKVYPVVFARLMNGQALSRFTHRDSYAVVQFRSDKGIAYEELAEATYRSYPVLERMQEWNTDPTVAYQDKIARYESEIGPSIYDIESAVPRIFYSWTWQNLGREEVDFVRKFLYARRGRVRAVWVSSYAEDLILKGSVGSSSTAFDVEYANLVQFLLDDDTNRRDIRIQLKNGTVFYRRISNFETVDEDTENFSIDSPLGVDITPSDVYRISWLTLMRLDNDEQQFNWASPTIASSALVLRSYNNDV